MISEETKQKITFVAETCIRCRRCMKECLMLGRFTENPKALFRQYLEKGPENMDRHIAYSCNECSQCTLKCPKGLNLKAVFQSLKSDYAEENQGIVPVDALLPSENGQEKECAPEYCTVLPGGHRLGTGKAKYLFIPGKFPAEPIIEHLRSSLGEHNVEVLPLQVTQQVSGEALSCLRSCGTETLITACPSSFRSLKEAVPERKILFYWDLMQDLIGIPQDAFREDVKLHLQGGTGDSVHWVLDQLGCQWTDEQQNMEVSDRDCRQVLGLLFDTKGKITAAQAGDDTKKEGNA